MINPDRPPLTTTELEQAIHNYLDDELRRPTTENIARRLDRTAGEVRDVFGALLQAGRATYEAGLMTLTDRYGPVRPDTMPPAPVKIQPPPKPKEAKDEMPRGIKRSWPLDADFVAEVDAIAARGGNISRELCEKYGVKNGALWQRIGDVRERLGLPRKLGRTHWAGSAKPQFVCTDCHDSGFVGGGTSGEVCTCPVGQSEAAKLKQAVLNGAKQAPACAECHDTGKSPDGGGWCTCFIGQQLCADAQERERLNPPAQPASAAPAATADPGQGVSTPAQDEPPTSPTDGEEGKGDEKHDCLCCAGEGHANGVPCDECNDIGTVTHSMYLRQQQIIAEQETKRSGISTTTPTAEQLPAIVAGLTGHPPTLGEVEEMMQEAEQGCEHDFKPLLPGSKPHTGGTLFFLGVGHSNLLAGFDAADAEQKRAAFEDAVAQLDEARRILRERDAELHRLDAKAAAAEMRYFGALATLDRPLLLLLDGAAIREVAAAPDTMPKPGDHLAEYVNGVDGTQQVNVLRCEAAGTTATGNPVRVMVLVYATAKGEAA